MSSAKLDFLGRFLLIDVFTFSYTYAKLTIDLANIYGGKLFIAQVIDTVPLIIGIGSFRSEKMLSRVYSENKKQRRDCER